MGRKRGFDNFTLPRRRGAKVELDDVEEPEVENDPIAAAIAAREKRKLGEVPGHLTCILGCKTISKVAQLDSLGFRFFVLLERSLSNADSTHVLHHLTVLYTTIPIANHVSYKRMCDCIIHLMDPLDLC